MDSSCYFKLIHTVIPCILFRFRVMILSHEMKWVREWIPGRLTTFLPEFLHTTSRSQWPGQDLGRPKMQHSGKKISWLKVQSSYFLKLPSFKKIDNLWIMEYWFCSVLCRWISKISLQYSSSIWNTHVEETTFPSDLSKVK